jgi:hypothetical protein
VRGTPALFNAGGRGWGAGDRRCGQTVLAGKASFSFSQRHQLPAKPSVARTAPDWPASLPNDSTRYGGP